jgi:cyclic pyranopterin phosphate synthase
VTADGTWFLCLYARTGLDLRSKLRGGATDGELRDLIAATWRGRQDRGAEERLAMGDRGRLAGKPELDRNPHLEMHTRGG